MVERALLFALIAGALIVLGSVAAAFNPIALVADALGSMNCPADFSAAACEAAI